MLFVTVTVLTFRCTHICIQHIIKIYCDVNTWGAVVLEQVRGPRRVPRRPHVSAWQSPQLEAQSSPLTTCDLIFLLYHTFCASASCKARWRLILTGRVPFQTLQHEENMIQYKNTTCQQCEINVATFPILVYDAASRVQPHLLKLQRTRQRVGTVVEVRG